MGGVTVPRRLSLGRYVAYEMVVAGDPPATNFSADVTSGTAPLLVPFSDLSTNSPTSWVWDFGDGDTSTEQNPAHTYNAAGTYTVTLIASNLKGGSGIETKTGYITVTEAGGGTGDPGDPMSLNADFLIATYYFTEANGTDLDTMSRINAPAGASTEGYIGYFHESTPVQPWMDWGGDNYGTGVEAVVINAKTINDAFPGQDIDVELRCYWYGEPVDGNMSMVIDAYLGGTVSHVGYGFVNTGGTKVATITRSKHITVAYPLGSELVGIFRYNRQTQRFEWLP